MVLSALYSFQLVLLFSFQQGMVDLKVGSYSGIGRELSERTELLRILGLVIYPLCPLLTMSRDQLCNHHGEKEAESGGGGFLGGEWHKVYNEYAKSINFLVDQAN